MFDELTIHEARPIVWLMRVLVVVIVAFLSIGMAGAGVVAVNIKSQTGGYLQ